MSASNASSIFPPGLSLLGGVPTKSQDLVASIIFEILYILLLPLAIWRFTRASDRCGALARPAVFILVRMATFIVRAAQADGQEGQNWFIAEQILLMCGTILAIDPLLKFVGFHITRHSVPSADKNGHTPLVMRLLELALLVALILGIYAGTKYGDLNDSSDLSTVKTCRDVNAIICLVVSAGAGLLVVVCQVGDNSLPARTTFTLAACGLLMSIVSGFRIYVYEVKPVPSLTSTGMKIAFYCFSSVPELATTLLYFALPLAKMTDLKNGVEKMKQSKQMRKAMLAGQAYEDPSAQGSTSSFDNTYPNKYPPPVYNRPQQQV